MKTLPILGLTALLIGCASTADDGPARERAVAALQAQFERFDADDSGSVSAAELEAARVARFAELDADGSGHLNREELMSARRTMSREDRRREDDAARTDRDTTPRERPLEPQDGRNRQRLDPRARLDGNRDGVVSLNEYIGESERFLSLADFNGNGEVTADELEKGITRLRTERQARRR